MDSITPFQAKAVVDAINEMFRNSHYFNICVVDNCMEVTGAKRTADYTALHLYHCRNFSQMDAATKEFVFRATMENVTNIDGFPAVRFVDRREELAEATMKSLTAGGRSFFQRLLGR